MIVLQTLNVTRPTLFGHSENVCVKFIWSEANLKREQSVTAPRRMKPVMRASEDGTLQWIDEQDLSAYRGKHIVALGRRIVAVGDTLEEALRKANLPKDAEPYIEWVADDRILIL